MFFAGRRVCNLSSRQIIQLSDNSRTRCNGKLGMCVGYPKLIRTRGTKNKKKKVFENLIQWYNIFENELFSSDHTKVTSERFHKGLIACGSTVPPGGYFH